MGGIHFQDVKLHHYSLRDRHLYVRLYFWLRLWDKIAVGSGFVFVAGFSSGSGGRGLKSSVCDGKVGNFRGVVLEGTIILGKEEANGKVLQPIRLYTTHRSVY